MTSGSAAADIHIQKRVTRPFPAFRERQDAGRNLVEFIKRGPQKGSIVLALPRGGVPVGEPLAEASGGSPQSCSREETSDSDLTGNGLWCRNY